MSEIPLRSVLTPTREPVTLRPNDDYITAGILSYGRGLFERPVVKGSETSYSTYYRLRRGQFVYSKLFAWEGALAVVDEEFDELFVSQEFPTFVINPVKATPAWLRLLCSWSETWERVRAGESGMGGRRKRVHPERLLDVVLPFPPVLEQRRIIDVMATIDAALRSASVMKDSAEALAQALRSDHFQGAVGPLMRAGDFFEITIGRQRSPKHAVGEHLVPYLRAANVKDGYLDLSDVKQMNFTPSEQGKFGLKEGDVLITEGCGSLSQLGAAAQWSTVEGDVVCFQNTLLRLRQRPGISTADYANQWARYCFESGAFAAIASGTNIFHIGSERAIEMAVVRKEVPEQEVFVATVNSADRLAEAARNEVNSLVALRRAALDELLGGSHTIPDGYDAFLESA